MFWKLILIMLFLLNLLLLMLSMIFSQLKHPLSMGFMLIIQTLLISLITGLINKSFWFSYILFLVFIGGMLVLFIYVTSLASNEMFNFSMKLLLISIIMLMLLLSIFFIMDLKNFCFIYNFEMINTNWFNMNLIENFDLIYKIYNYPTNWMTCLMINYLFFTLIVVVKVTSFFYGPIRNMN